MKSHSLVLALLSTSFLSVGITFCDLSKFSAQCRAADTMDHSPVKTEERALAHFTGLDLAIPGQVNVSIGSPQKVRITCNQDTLSNVITEVSDGVLRVRIKDKFNVEKFEANVVMEKLETVQQSSAGRSTMKGLSKAGLKKIAVMGASSANFEDIRGEQLDLVVAGASKVTATGIMDKLHLTVSGASSATLAELKTKDCKLKVYSASRASVNASANASGQVNGASHLDLKGTATNNIAVDFISKVSRN